MLHMHWLNYVAHASFAKLLLIPNGPQTWYVLFTISGCYEITNTLAT